MGEFSKHPIATGAVVVGGAAGGFFLARALRKLVPFLWHITIFFFGIPVVMVWAIVAFPLMVIYRTPGTWKFARNSVITSGWLYLQVAESLLDRPATQAERDHFMVPKAKWLREYPW